jgi:hypothetical protein
MRRSLASLTLGLFAACGGDSIPLKDLQTKEIDARCAYLVKCGLFADNQTCETFFIVTADPSAQAAIDAKKLSYNGENAASCLDQIKSASCNSSDKTAREQPEPCKHIFNGLAKMGEACAFDTECQSANCVIPGGATGDCPQGMCGAEIPLAKAGESCTGVDCVEGNFCNGMNQCQPLVQMGGACDFSSDCDFGLGCIGATTMTCQPVPHIGSACPDGACEEIGANCNASKSCVKVGLPGDACTVDTDCTFFGVCDTASTKCANYPSRGQMCDADHLVICSDDSWCNIPMGQTTGTCDAPQANGATCTQGDQCSSHFCKDTGAAGMCADPDVCI